MAGDATEFHGPNLGWAVELHERMRADPSSVAKRDRELLEDWSPPAAAGTAPADAERIARALGYVRALRAYGHRAAELDPLGDDPPGDPALDLETHGLSREDLRALPAALAGGPVATSASDLLEAADALRGIYCSTSGYDFEHIHDPAERAWLREAVEERRFRPPADPVDAVALLERLTAVETFERFLHGVFPGRTRFSLEGLDMLVPMLDELLALAAGSDARSVMIGTPHRGRLNLLAHVLEMGYEPILADFKHQTRAKAFREDVSWTGDVTYHQGARHRVGDADGETVRLVVTLPPNPSHVELIDPVLAGMARAAGTDAGEPGAPRFSPSRTLPLLVHGDAAFPGQGVVAETLNLARLDGYTAGGVVHMIANNQLGFTTDPGAGRGTRYASDVAEGYKVPAIHVNADDPIACLEAVRIAFAFRNRFWRDFVVDLIGYRRHGHNEGDEPAFTQPRLYARIADHPTVRALWAQACADEGAIGEERADGLVRARRRELEEILERVGEEAAEAGPDDAGLGAATESGDEAPETGVPLDDLRALNDELMTDPEGFTFHRKVNKARERRRGVLDDADEPTVDWATAEELALASVLADGVPVRLTGEDAQRGTFSQRHAVLHDAEDGDALTPLQRIGRARAACEILNSPLSENAALGFEYGYSIQAPDRLVLWEAQYGDFVNNAQAVIDEFLVSGRAKWRQRPSLVLLLPHGHEGQGPDHSSARPERFLSLAADRNLVLANPTTAAQYFHLLRLQAARLATEPTPLVVLTPKSLLRHARTRSTPRELAEGSFRPVLDDPEVEDADAVRRVVLCSGKLFVDLADAEHERHAATALVRVERPWPFPADRIAEILERYPEAREVVWAQEEPENMGAWPTLRAPLEELVGQAGGHALLVVARARSASPAEGAAAIHESNQRILVDAAFAPDAAPEGGMVTYREVRGGTHGR